VVVVSDYDERFWLEDHWVYRFSYGDQFVYRRWYNDRWEDERRESSFWGKIKWERASHNDRDDGRRFENEQNREEKKEKNLGIKQENKHKGGHK